MKSSSGGMATILDLCLWAEKRARGCEMKGLWRMNDSMAHGVAHERRAVFKNDTPIVTYPGEVEGWLLDSYECRL